MVYLGMGENLQFIWEKYISKRKMAHGPFNAYNRLSHGVNRLDRPNMNGFQIHDY